MIKCSKTVEKKTFLSIPVSLVPLSRNTIHVPAFLHGSKVFFCQTVMLAIYFFNTFNVFMPIALA